MLGCRLADCVMCASRLTKGGDGNRVALELEVRSRASDEIGGEIVCRDGIGGGLNVDFLGGLGDRRNGGVGLGDRGCSSSEV